MIEAFIGAAGTGKTYNLLHKTFELANRIHWADHQSILAITFMHGSRQRMQKNLREIVAEGKKVTCTTIDSFSLEIVRRFRSYIPILGNIVPITGDKRNEFLMEDAVQLNFEEIRIHASYLIKLKPIKECVTSSFPIVLIDEFQDCQNGLLEVIKALSECCDLLIAADPFQFLDECSDNTEAIKWLYNKASITELNTQHRTSNSSIINTALALRENKRVPNVIDIKGIDGNGGLAAWNIDTYIAWKYWHKRAALISPVAPTKSKFVEQTLSSLSKELGRKIKLGPYPFMWENPPETMLESICNDLESIIRKKEITVSDLKRLSSTGNPSYKHYMRYVYKYAMLRGIETITMAQLQFIVSGFISKELIYNKSNYQNGRIATTIHGAKNREFDYVFILWPYKIQNNYEYQRKLLYNAVTRAKNNALLIVEGGEKRISKEKILKLLISNYN